MGMNARFRFYRYVPGAVYRPHVDGEFQCFCFVLFFDLRQKYMLMVSIQVHGLQAGRINMGNMCMIYTMVHSDQDSPLFCT